MMTQKAVVSADCARTLAGVLAGPPPGAARGLMDSRGGRGLQQSGLLAAPVGHCMGCG